MVKSLSQRAADVQVTIRDIHEFQMRKYQKSKRIRYTNGLGIRVR